MCRPRRLCFDGLKRLRIAILTLKSPTSLTLGEMVSLSMQSFIEIGTEIVKVFIRAIMDLFFALFFALEGVHAQKNALLIFYIISRPDLVEWKKVERRQVRERIESAFHVMDKEYGVTRLLDPEGNTLLKATTSNRCCFKMCTQCARAHARTHAKCTKSGICVYKKTSEPNFRFLSGGNNNKGKSF